MKGKDSALTRDRNLAKIKLLCCDSGHRDVRLEKANASAAGKHTFRSHITFFSYSKLKSRFKRMSLAKKKKLILKILSIFAESVPQVF